MRKRYCGALTIWLTAVSLALGQGRPGGPAVWPRGVSGSGPEPAQPGLLVPACYPPAAAGYDGPPPTCIVYGPLGQPFVLPGAKASSSSQPAAPGQPLGNTPGRSQSTWPGPASSRPAVVQIQAWQQNNEMAGFLPASDKTMPPDKTPTEDNNPSVVPESLEDPLQGAPLGNDWQAPRQDRRPPVGPRGYLFFGRAEFLYWLVRDQPYRNLLQYGTGAGAIIVPSDALHFDSLERQGARLSAGAWLDAEQTMALEVGGFLLGSHDTHTVVGSGGNPPLVINYFEVANSSPGTIELTGPPPPAVPTPPRWIFGP